MSAFSIHALIGGMVLWFRPVLASVPMPVLTGLFLYLGQSALGGNQMYERGVQLISDPSQDKVSSARAKARDRGRGRVRLRDRIRVRDRDREKATSTHAHTPTATHTASHQHGPGRRCLARWSPRSRSCSTLC